jgi:hypothetical protein
MGEVSERPSPAEIWASLAVCGACGKPVALCADPIIFVAPMTVLPPPARADGKRGIKAALYFRDPFHHPSLPFENYCDAACSLAAAEAA